MEIKNDNHILNIDPITDFGKKGGEDNEDYRTDFGKGISFKSVDGKEWASYENAMAYNQWYYESKIMPIKDKKGMHR